MSHGNELLQSTQVSFPNIIRIIVVELCQDARLQIMSKWLNFVVVQSRQVLLCLSWPIPHYDHHHEGLSEEQVHAIRNKLLQLVLITNIISILVTLIAIQRIWWCCSKEIDVITHIIPIMNTISWAMNPRSSSEHHYHHHLVILTIKTLRAREYCQYCNQVIKLTMPGEAQCKVQPCYVSIDNKQYIAGCLCPQYIRLYQ